MPVVRRLGTCGRTRERVVVPDSVWSYPRGALRYDHAALRTTTRLYVRPREAYGTQQNPCQRRDGPRGRTTRRGPVPSADTTTSDPGRQNDAGPGPAEVNLLRHASVAGGRRSPGAGTRTRPGIVNQHPDEKRPKQPYTSHPPHPRNTRNRLFSTDSGAAPASEGATSALGDRWNGGRMRA